MKEQIQVQEKAAMSRAEAFVDWLEENISELKKREDELKQLSLSEDDIHFLQVIRQTNTYIGYTILCIRL